jgi:hypothetical protein
MVVIHFDTKNTHAKDFKAIKEEAALSVYKYICIYSYSITVFLFKYQSPLNFAL